VNDDAGRDRRRTELVVEPIRLGGRRSTSRGRIAAVVAAIFIGVAIWKPWEGAVKAPTGSSAPTSPAASALSAASTSEPAGSRDATGGGMIGHVLPNDGQPFPSNAELLAATTRQPTWGLRAMVLRPGGPTFAGRPNLLERWVAVDADGDPGSAPSPAIARADEDVAAIGVTTLDDALPLDVRFWSLPTNGPPQRITAIAIPGPEAGSWLWLPDRAHATDRGTWQAGDYRIEVLLGPRVVRLGATIPSASQTTNRVAGPYGQPPFEQVLQHVESGPFAMADGGARSLVGGTPPVADDREAWLGSAAGLPPVAVVAARQVTAFGMLLADGGEPLGVVVRRLEPGSAPIETGANIVTVEPGRRAIIAFPAFGGVFLDGAYHVTVSWTAGGADRSASWAVEIEPSIQPSPPGAPLDLMRPWVGLLERPDNEARQPLVFIVDATAGTDQCAPSTTITGSDPFLGIVAPPGARIVRVRMVPLDVIRSADIAIRYAPEAIPRLTVVALPPGGLPVRDYDLFLTLETASGVSRIAQRVCVAVG
jgi:hypothetical protein